jgi:hypothetical protein
MNRTLQATDERINTLVDELARMTGQDYVTAMCQALEEMHERLTSVPRRAAPWSFRVVIEFKLPAVLLHRGDR